MAALANLVAADDTHVDYGEQAVCFASVCAPWRHVTVSVHEACTHAYVGCTHAVTLSTADGQKGTLPAVSSQEIIWMLTKAGQPIPDHFRPR